MAILKVQNLTKRFVNGSENLTVLDNVDLEIEKGESVAIVGPSGSGKSTLLGILAGLDEPTEGSVSLLGRELGRMNEQELSRLWGTKVGFIFQSYRLLPTLTALENTLVPLELARRENAEDQARSWLAKVGLTERLDHLPSQLSGGEQQRVALARAMATDPEILFADEPTGNLDSKTGKEMADLLLSLVKEHETTLVMVTHEPSLASRTSRRIEIADGQIRKDTRMP